MSELSDKFNSLPADFQQLLRLAQDEHRIEITPLQEMKGGRTGAFLFLVSVSYLETNKIQHLVLKLDHKSKKTRLDELERHLSAIEQAPGDFVRNHIAELAFERVEQDEAIAIFYAIAGQSLHHFSSLATYREQSKLEKIFRETNSILLDKWNTGSIFEKAVHPQKIMSRWLGYRLQPGGNIERFMQDYCRVDPDIPGLMIQGNIFPNPLLFSRKEQPWGDARPIDTISGFQHGDLNIGNILAKFKEEDGSLAGYYLIDFALFKGSMPLLYDKAYLEMSYLLREMARVSFDKWVQMVNWYAARDILDPQQVPIELAGPCAVINAGRKAFGEWVEQNHPSLGDDLLGQYRLAAVAAGLNYCNKASIDPKERLAGLVFAAAHLKHYHTSFGVPLPSEVKYLNMDVPEEAISDNSPKPVHGTAARISLPYQATAFMGRSKEIQAIRDLLEREDIRLLTLTGPGGTGKTRLALKVAEGVAGSFQDGIHFIDLASVTNPEDVMATIARTIGYRETSGRSLFEELVANLRMSRLLLILDNFEQLTGAAPQVGELLRSCLHVRLLVTSREALHISGEHVFSVPPLGLPGAEQKGMTPEEISGYEAVSLFVERASAVRSDFKLTEENAQVVAEICSRLDGLPLAIELAAARITLFSPRALLERVGDSLKLLRGGARDIPARQQTLRGAIDWSFELLDEAEKKLFSLLSIFHGCTFEQVEVVAGAVRQLDEVRIDIFDGLGSLLDKSLIRRTDQGNGETRLLMMGTIREYAKEQLDSIPEFGKEARKAHASYFSNYAQLKWKSIAGDDRVAALDEVEADIDNVRSSWDYWVKEGNLEELRKLTDFLWLYYDARGWYYASAGLTTDLLQMLSTVQPSPERVQQQILLQSSLARVMMAINGCTPEVEQAYTRAFELCEDYGDVPQSFPVIRALAGFYAYIADFARSAEFGKRLLDLGEKLDDVNMKAEGCLVYGYNLAFLGNPLEALDYLKKGVALYDPALHGAQRFRFANNPGVTAYTTSALLYWMTGSPGLAVQNAENAVQLAEKLNHPYVYAYALFHTALLNLWRLDFNMVIERSEAALQLARKHEFPIWEAVATCLHGAASAGMDPEGEGYEEFERGMEMYAGLKTPPVFWPILLLLRSGTLIQTGRVQEALEPVEQALTYLGQNEGNPLVSEFYRVKGEILMMISGENVDQAESLYRKALALATRHHAKMFELKAATSLGKLLKGKDKEDEGMQILKDTYAKFTEGFDEKDLVMAREVIAGMSVEK